MGNPVSVGVPCSVSVKKSRKRKRLKENLAQLASEGEVNTPMFKRRSNEVARMSFGASFLDTTADTSATPNQGMAGDYIYMCIYMYIYIV